MEKQYKNGLNDLITGIIFCLFSGAYFLLATKIPIPDSMKASLLDAASIPKLWGGMMFILGIIILVRGLFKMNGARKAGYKPDGEDPVKKMTRGLVDARSAIAMFVILFIYIAIMQGVGFLLSTILFLFGEFFVLTRKEERKLWLIAVMAVVFGFAIYALFKYGFTMPLPRGIITFI